MSKWNFWTALHQIYGIYPFFSINKVPTSLSLKLTFATNMRCTPSSYTYANMPNSIAVHFLKLVLGGGGHDGRHLGAAVNADPAPWAVTVCVTLHLSPLLPLPHLPLAVAAEQEAQHQHEEDGKHQEHEEVDICVGYRGDRWLHIIRAKTKDV